MKKALKSFRKKISSKKLKNSFGKTNSKNKSKSEELPETPLKIAAKSPQAKVVPEKENEAQIQRQIKNLIERQFTQADFLTTQFPNFKESLVMEKEYIFIKKCMMCCVLFSFKKNFPEEFVRQRDAKTQILFEINSHVLTPKDWFTPNAATAIYALIKSNLFVPPSIKPSLLNTDFFPSPHWLHLGTVYEILLRLLASSQVPQPLLENIFNKRFAGWAVERFRIAHTAETVCLQRLLHRMYSRFRLSRPFIRGRVACLLQETVINSLHIAGMSQLLIFIRNIISGYLTPLKTENKDFFFSRLLPIFESPYLQEFVNPFVECLREYILKDRSLFEQTILRILVHERNVCGRMAFVMIFKELIAVSGVMKRRELQSVAKRVISRVALCLNDCHQQVAECALSLLEDEHFQALVELDVEAHLPIILSALERNSGHWNDFVREQSERDFQMALSGNTRCEELMEEFRAGQMKIEQNINESFSVYEEIRKYNESFV